MKKIVLVVAVFILVLSGCGGSLSDEELLDKALNNFEYKGEFVSDSTVDNKLINSETHSEILVEDKNNFSVISTSGSEVLDTEFYMRDGIIYYYNTENQEYYRSESEKFKKFMTNMLERIKNYSQDDLGKLIDYDIAGEDDVIQLDGDEIMDVRKITLTFDDVDVQELINNMDIDEDKFVGKVLKVYGKLLNTISGKSIYYIDPESKKIMKLESDSIIDAKIIGEITTSSEVDYTHMGEKVEVVFPEELDSADTILEGALEGVLEEGKSNS